MRCIILITWLLGVFQLMHSQEGTNEGNNEPVPSQLASLYMKEANSLGEGALWDPHQHHFLFVDIENGKVNCCDLTKPSCNKWNVGKKVGTVVFTSSEDLLAVALEDGIYLLSKSSGNLSLLCAPEKEMPGNRFNDGKCSPAGNLWAGTMSMSGQKKAGALYRITGKGIYTKMISGVSTSNGIVWSPDSTKMYYIDTPTSQVMEFDYNWARDTIFNPRIAITIPKELGYPDGMSIDAEGKLWIAHWGGYGVYRWDPVKGILLQKVEVPAKNVTSCAFSGRDLKKLFITTARIGNSSQDLEKFPLAGSVFSIRTEIEGIRAHPLQIP